MAISYTQNGIIFDNINYGEGALPVPQDLQSCGLEYKDL